MEELIKSLRTIFDREFPGSTFVPEHSVIRVGGALLWTGFEDLDQVDRQKRLWDSMAALDDRDRGKVSLIVTFTPDEYEIIRAESA